MKNNLLKNKKFQILFCKTKIRFCFFHLSILIAFLHFGSSAFADFSFTNITENEMTQITKEMSANFTHNSLIGASKLGSIFGFEFGLTAAQTAIPNTNTVIKRTTSSDVPNMYNAGLLGAIGVPFGLSFEAVLVPKTTVAGADVNTTSLALKWNINDVVPLPLNVALRGVYSTAKLSFNQTISGQSATVENKTTVSGFQILVSPQLPIFEPYAGIGFLNGSNEVSVTGTTGTVFDSYFSTSQSEKKTAGSTQFFLGANVSLAVIKLGAEYSQNFGTSRYGLKLGLAF